jgi:hypothetical protein
MHLLESYLLLSLFISFSLANVEKTIFLGPPAITISTAHPNLDDLSLISVGQNILERLFSHRGFSQRQ